jgi:hypothetical protein
LLSASFSAILVIFLDLGVDIAAVFLKRWVEGFGSVAAGQSGSLWCDSAADEDRRGRLRRFIGDITILTTKQLPSVCFRSFDAGTPLRIALCRFKDLLLDNKGSFLPLSLFWRRAIKQ